MRILGDPKDTNHPKKTGQPQELGDVRRTRVRLETVRVGPRRGAKERVPREQENTARSLVPLRQEVGGGMPGSLRASSFAGRGACSVHHLR